ncbi:DUF397 domain-containing protein [Micromonospora sp. NBC_01813]|uniref:DUF397 domain-containing protein n=1 Tax=Micromonospora sp. NBC_01813 TaxID=2975988 RepID=UPI002DDB4FCC|nr:DUF397 domain-containing protein [Micromonospora sp. NBC_01813]WSA11171.1 DUF397 domain-containing protein [Micromonospora sp. NBC_01813]
MNSFSVTGWRKSTRSGGDDNCVEVNLAGDRVGVRDSKAGLAGPVLTFSCTSFDSLIHSLSVERGQPR